MARLGGGAKQSGQGRMDRVGGAGWTEWEGQDGQSGRGRMDRVGGAGWMEWEGQDR